jgi:hypothetical protein
LFEEHGPKALEAAFLQAFPSASFNGCRRCAPSLAGSTQFAYDWLVEFVETPLFSQLLADYLDDEEYRALQLYLAGEPEAGSIIPATGGFRKLRWSDRRRGKGKRGGLRVIYYYLVADFQIWLFTLFDKDEASDLSPAEKRTLKAAIQDETRQRRNRRSPRKR